MVKANELKAAMARKGMTQQQVADAIGITHKTLYNKLKKGVFLSDEIEKLIVVLDISNPMDVFFS